MADMNGREAEERWREMESLAHRAAADSKAVLAIVGAAASRGEAAASLSVLLQAPLRLADQLLDLELSRFIESKDP